MTRQEFEDSVTSTFDIYYFCNDNGYEHFVENWFTGDCLDDIVENELSSCIDDYLRNHYWHNLMNDLEAIPRGYQMYRRDDYSYLDICEIDSDFDELYGDLLKELETDDFFEESDEPEEDDDEGDYSNPLNVLFEDNGQFEMPLVIA